ncbi:hypothetical protein T4D_1459 [Trichinella pseudospiralis]|uniref:Uncharacterized protein n=1 Tax=Trichinella pseudospiralis TaxID=6337 RepID=A0A0V1FEL6_TRIPS|nr:hypothetical protein T4D_1459 [Trichinella pseudospiralis]
MTSASTSNFYDSVNALGSEQQKTSYSGIKPRRSLQVCTLRQASAVVIVETRETNVSRLHGHKVSAKATILPLRPKRNPKGLQTRKDFRGFFPEFELSCCSEPNALTES